MPSGYCRLTLDVVGYAAWIDLGPICCTCACHCPQDDKEVFDAVTSCLSAISTNATRAAAIMKEGALNTIVSVLTNMDIPQETDATPAAKAASAASAGSSATAPAVTAGSEEGQAILKSARKGFMLIEKLARADTETFGKSGAARAVVKLAENKEVKDAECAASMLGTLDRASKSADCASVLQTTGGARAVIQLIQAATARQKQAELNRPGPGGTSTSSRPQSWLSSRQQQQQSATVQSGGVARGECLRVRVRVRARTDTRSRC